MLAATLARGTTRLVNAAREPEVDGPRPAPRRHGREDLGRRHRDDRGRRRRARCTAPTHPIIPDRIEAGTYALAAAATRGDVAVRALRAGAPRGADRPARRRRASRIDTIGDTLRVRADGPLLSHDVATAPYPGFPTDLQAQWMALAAGMEGVATITETIFENRFQHVAELVAHGREASASRAAGRSSRAVAADAAPRSWRATCAPRRPWRSPPSPPRARPRSTASTTSTGATRRWKRSSSDSGASGVDAGRRRGDPD